MASLVWAALCIGNSGKGGRGARRGETRRGHGLLRKMKSAEDVRCGTQRDDSAVGML